MVFKIAILSSLLTLTSATFHGSLLNDAIDGVISALKINDNFMCGEKCNIIGLPVKMEHHYDGLASKKLGLYF